jgi:hypothetical protein
LEPEDGRLTVYGIDDVGTPAFSEFGIENLRELIQIHKDLAKSESAQPSRAPAGP